MQLPSSPGAISVRGILLLLLFIVLYLIPHQSQAQDQNQNVLSVTRVFPKIDKVGVFEKALTAHAQKYHKGDWKWRVSEIMSGPDVGGYNIIEGPSTWDQVDKRGDLGSDHQNDWNSTIAVHLTDRYQSFFLEYRPELSNAELTNYSDKYAVNHVFIKPGMNAATFEILTNLKKVWAASNQSIVVYEASASGAPQFVIVTRYRNGLKERQTGFMKPMKERYEAVMGDGSFQKYLDAVASVTDHTWSELLFTRLDLSSK